MRLIDDSPPLEILGTANRTASWFPDNLGAGLAPELQGPLSYSDQ